jgi:uncharacterized coiled-coil protein SlyX
MQTPVQLPTLPLHTKPDCLVWYAGDSCDQLIQQYNQNAQLRQQQEWQLQVITPLQKQIAEQQKQIAGQQAQIKALQLKLVSQTADALQNQARNQALLDGIGVILGAGLAFLVTVAAFRRLARNSPAFKEEQGRAASA